MTLTILDPRTGQKVTISVPDVPAAEQAAPANVATHLQSPGRRS